MEKSKDAQPVPATTRRRWWPRIHFSLRTLLLTVLTVASGATLWWNWGPWQVAFRVEEFSSINTISFSDDDQFLLINFQRAMGSAPITPSNPMHEPINSLDVRRVNTGERLHLLEDLRCEGTAEIAGDYVILKPIDPSAAFGPPEVLPPVIFNYKTGVQLKPAANLFKRGDHHAQWQLSSHFMLINYGAEDSDLVRLPDFKQIKKLPKDTKIQDYDCYTFRNKNHLVFGDLNTDKTFTTQDCEFKYAPSTVNLRSEFWMTSTLFVFTQWIENPPRFPFQEPTYLHDWITYVFDAKSGALLTKKEGRVADLSLDGRWLLIASNQANILLNFPANVETKFESDHMKLFCGGTLLFDESQHAMLDTETFKKKWQKPDSYLHESTNNDGLVFVYISNPDYYCDELLEPRTGRSITNFSERRWIGTYNVESVLTFSHNGNALGIAQKLNHSSWHKTDIDEERATVLRRRRPIAWYGLAWLPEFWLTVLFSAGLIWSLFRDRRNA